METRIQKEKINLVTALEHTEAIYWSKYYNNNTRLKAVSKEISGAFVFAVPQLDILAMNRVIGLGMEKEVTKKDIEEIKSFFKYLNVKRFFIQVSPFVKQENLDHLLRKAGFRFYNNWSKLLRISNRPVVEPQTDLQIINVTTDEAHLYGETIAKSFGWEHDEIQNWISSSISKPGYRHYLVTDNYKVVAAGALHLMDSYASLAFAATLPEYRGMGAQSLLLYQRVKDAQLAGAEYIISETAEDLENKPVTSYRNMRRFDFDLVYNRPNWIIEP